MLIFGQFATLRNKLYRAFVSEIKANLLETVKSCHDTQVYKIMGVCSVLIYT